MLGNKKNPWLQGFFISKWCNRQDLSALRRTRLSSLSKCLLAFLMNRSDSSPVSEHEKNKNPFFRMSFWFYMVQPTGLEPVTSSFAGRRSNPTELRLHGFSGRGNIVKRKEKASVSLEDCESLHFHENTILLVYRVASYWRHQGQFFFDWSRGISRGIVIDFFQKVR
jgi:hypothetical protein